MTVSVPIARLVDENFRDVARDRSIFGAFWRPVAPDCNPRYGCIVCLLHVMGRWFQWYLQSCCKPCGICCVESGSGGCAEDVCRRPRLAVPDGEPCGHKLCRGYGVLLSDGFVGPGAFQFPHESAMRYPNNVNDARQSKRPLCCRPASRHSTVERMSGRGFFCTEDVRVPRWATEKNSISPDEAPQTILEP